MAIRKQKHLYIQNMVNLPMSFRTLLGTLTHAFETDIKLDYTHIQFPPLCQITPSSSVPSQPP